MNKSPNNKLIAKKRGESWKKALKMGKFTTLANPSLIRQERVTMGLSQAELAKKAGLAVNTYVAIECAKRPVTEERARVILRAINKTPSKYDRYFSESGKSGKYVARLKE